MFIFLLYGFWLTFAHDVSGVIFCVLFIRPCAAELPVIRSTFKKRLVKLVKLSAISVVLFFMCIYIYFFFNCTFLMKHASVRRKFYWLFHKIRYVKALNISDLYILFTAVCKNFVYSYEFVKLFSLTNK